ncbi:ERF family protein [Sporosarcina sp. Sa2YVA2]|uniref:ERF family protein n=1 Tax=Sporosarcina quadrami TaxID=2762234 RepID=A0ABR8U8S9_9BACL|nr:ERF family protein [Sporosarcina quadrami]MBD7984442.1 ERF family protein [Sporosarcina quadrami]
MRKSESIAELAKALSGFQGEVKQPMKDKDNPFFKSKYVPLENVVEAITETAPKHGLSFLQYPVNQDERVGIVTLLMHSSGEWIETEPIFAKPGKNDAQATGSVVTYLKRYSLSAVFGITSDEDDDGNNASQPTAKPKADNNITQNQLNTILAKTNNIAKRDSIGQGQVWENAQKALGVTKRSADLTKQEAGKFIDYLTSQEG